MSHPDTKVWIPVGKLIFLLRGRQNIFYQFFVLLNQKTLVMYVSAQMTARWFRNMTRQATH